QIFEQLQGAVFKITLSPKMEITKFEGFDALVKKIAARDEDAATVFKGWIKEDAVKRPLETWFRSLPNKPVAKGDTWETKLSVAFGPLGTLATENTYTFQGTEKADGKELAKITVATKATYAPPEGDTGLPFKITKGDLKAEGGKGTLLFDPEAGRLVRV